MTTRSLVLLPGIGGYQQTIVYVGAYTRLTAFPFPAGSGAPIAAVSPDCGRDEGKTLRIGDHECTVTVVPSDMDVYHPLHYIPPASENLKKTLYVFSPSCEDALSLAAFPHVSVDMFIDRLILAAPLYRAQLYERRAYRAGVSGWKIHGSPHRHQRGDVRV